MSKNTIIVVLGISIGMTAVGHLIDSDQVNNGLVQFLFELLFLVIVCFLMNTLLYLAAKFIARQMRWVRSHD